MDMTLYALLMNKLQGQSECLTWNGFGLEVVDAIPESPLPNVIYLQKSEFTVEDYKEFLQTISSNDEVACASLGVEEDGKATRKTSTKKRSKTRK